MIELFRRNLFINTLLLLPYAVVLRLHTFIWPNRYFYQYDGENIFFKWIYELLSVPLSQSIVATLLVYIHALILNHISIRNRLGREYTLFPGALYILLISMGKETVYLSPSLISVSLVLIMIVQMFRTYKNQNATTFIFNAGFFAGLAFLLSPHLIFFLLFGYIGLMILRSFKMLERFQYTAGFLVPMILSFSLLYFFKVDVTDSISTFITEFGWIDWNSTAEVKTYIFVGVVFFFFFLSFLSYNRYTLRKSIQAQKKIDLIFWLAFFSLTTTMTNSEISYLGIIILICSISTLFAMNLSWIKNKLYTELIHLSLLAILVYIFYL